MNKTVRIEITGNEKTAELYVMVNGQRVANAKTIFVARSFAETIVKAFRAAGVEVENNGWGESWQ